MNNCEALYQERLARIKKAIACEPVDRVPVIFQGTAFAPRYMGMTLAEYVNDPFASQDATIGAMEKVGDVDGINVVAVSGKTNAGQMGLQKRKMPGRELPEDSLWQVVESEVMKVEDYDTVIDKGWDAFVEAAIPRIMSEREIAAAKENRAWVVAHHNQEVQKFRNHGYPIIAEGGGPGMVPMENFAGARSLPKFIMDLYRIPDKVIAATERGMSDAKKSFSRMTIDAKHPGLGMWVGGWRGAPSFLSPKLFNKFFWPYFRTIVEWTVDKGLVPVLHLDQDWTRELSRLLELPPKKCLLNPDGMTDLRKFRQIVGDRMAVMGDIPAQLFSLGAPDDIYKYVRDLIRDIGPTGLLLAPGCDAPYNAKPENVEAFVAAGHEYGSVK
jgi:uroporphyrinogen-III decarboxylase